MAGFWDFMCESVKGETVLIWGEDEPKRRYIDDEILDRLTRLEAENRRLKRDSEMKRVHVYEDKNVLERLKKIELENKKLKKELEMRKIKSIDIDYKLLK